MMRWGISASVGLALALTVWATPTASAKGLPPCPNATLTPAALTPEAAGAAVACEVNKQRKIRRLRRVSIQLNLVQAASVHTTEMVSNGFFSHLGLDGTVPAARIIETGYLVKASSWAVGENIHWGTGTVGSPQATVAMWMNSPTHRQILLDRRWRHVGIGVRFGTPWDPAAIDAATYTAEFGFRRR